MRHAPKWSSTRLSSRADWKLQSTLPGLCMTCTSNRSTMSSGGGGIYMMFPQQDLKTRISSFEEIPRYEHCLSLGLLGRGQAGRKTSILEQGGLHPPVPISAVSRFFRQASIASMNKADGSSYMSNRSSFSNIPRLASPLEYSQGVLTLARRVRDSIRAIKPDAIVMGETTSGCPGPGLGGGLSADLPGWLSKTKTKWPGHPCAMACPK